MKKRVGLWTIVVAILAATTLDVGAQRSGSAVRKSSTAVKAEQALPMTCLQAWIAAGKRYPDMLAIVTTLAKVSLVNRGLTLPNSRETGVEAGKGIADECKADPNALLFAVVDKQVRRVAKPAAH